MNKEGLSHIEVILGFVIFMIAITFLLASYNPLFKENYNEEQLVVRLYDEFLENTSVNVRNYYLFKEESSPEKLIIQLNENMEGYGLVAVDETEKRYGLSIIDLKNGIVCINNLDAVKNFLTIRAIENFSTTYLPASDCLESEDTYDISTKYDENIILLEKIKNFNFSYYENLAGLKNSLNLNQINNFDYNITIEGKSYLGRNNAESAKVNVYSAIRKTKIINEEGLKVEAELLFRIW